MAVKKQVWTVRVINPVLDGPAETLAERDALQGMWVEQLRYMGHVRVLGENATRQVLEFRAPRHLDSKIWASQNAARMRSFGLNAVEAPEWNGVERVEL